MSTFDRDHVYCFEARFPRIRQLALRDLAKGIDEQKVRQKYRLSNLALAAWRRCGTVERFKREECHWQKELAALEEKYAIARANYLNYWLHNLKSTRGTALHFHVTNTKIYQWLREDGYWPDKEAEAQRKADDDWREARKLYKQVKRIVSEQLKGTNRQNA